MFRQLDSDLWVTERPLRFFGAQIGTRMTVIKLRDGSLIVHSPVLLDSATRVELDALGQVRFIVAPNRYHHLFVADYARAYPDARLLGAPGLNSKRKDLNFSMILDDEPPPEWVGQIEQVVFRAFPPLSEVIFFHRSSRTVIFTDLLFNIRTPESAYTRFLLKLDGGLNQVAVPRSFRLLIRMRAALAGKTINRVLSWDFDRLSMAHGEIIDHGAKGIVRAAWSFVLPAT